MLELISKRYDEKIPCFNRSFAWKDDPHSGFGFDCDENGNVDAESMHPTGRANWEFCLADKGATLIDEGVQDYSYIVHHWDVRRCECGKPLEMCGDSMGEVECEHCGRVYNIFGQRLKGRTEAWQGQNEYGEYYDDY